MEEERSYPFAQTANDPDAVYTFLRDSLKLDKRPEEHFITLALDSKNHIIGVFDDTTGGINACAIAPSKVFRAALTCGASFVIVAHNHPSGDPYPSDHDTEATERLKKCGDILGIPLVDHIIMGSRSYFDYEEETALFD